MIGCLWLWGTLCKICKCISYLTCSNLGSLLQLGWELTHQQMNYDIIHTCQSNKMKKILVVIWLSSQRCDLVVFWFKMKVFLTSLQDVTTSWSDVKKTFILDQQTTSKQSLILTSRQRQNNDFCPLGTDPTRAQLEQVEYRSRWVPSPWGLRWPCAFHVFCVNFICVGYRWYTGLIVFSIIFF